MTKTTETITTVNGASAAITAGAIQESGVLIAVAVEVGTFTNGAVTVTHTLFDKDDVQLYTKAAIADAATDVVILTADTRLPIGYGWYSTITPSGDPGSATSVTIHYYISDTDR